MKVSLKIRAMKKKSIGFTLLEFLIVIAVIGGLIAGVLILQGQANSGVTTNKAVRSITLIEGKVRQLFASSGSYVKLTPAFLNGVALIPEPFKYVGTNMLDPYGNTMSVNGGASSFALTVGGTTAPLDKEVCASLASDLSSSATTIRIGSAATAAVGVIAGGNVYKATGGVVDEAALATGCAETATVIAYQYR